MRGVVTSKGSYSIAVIGNYLPRRCGLATFTTDVSEALAAEMESHDDDVIAVAMTDIEEGYAYPERVKFSVSTNVQADYLRAAEFLNSGSYDAIFLQHEYGIFGGDDGSHILHLVKNLRSPLITTLHTVLLRPTDSQKHIIQELAQCSHYLTVMSHKAEKILTDVYAVPAEKVVFIPHGIPDVPLQSPDITKELFGFEGHQVVLTFGLLGPNKGIENMIKAMPDIVSKYKDVIYVIIGATHPQIKRQHGEDYRLSLQQLAAELGVEDHVWFYNRFVELSKLVQYLLATDIYVTPYLQPEQIVSGTLAYALGAGNAIVSTPYWYAEELLDQERGILVPFDDYEATGEAVSRLLSSEDERNLMCNKAYNYSRTMTWKEVARQYITLVGNLSADDGVREKGITKIIQERAAEYRLLDKLPEINLSHLRTLTDDTGILQHAFYDIPNRSEGYCVDDNARALVVSCAHYWHRKDKSVMPLIRIYLAFILNSFNEDTGRFRNFMSYDRRWLDDVGSNDCHGRAVWCLGYTVHYAPTELIRLTAMALYKKSLAAVPMIESPRALAFSIIGMCHYLENDPGDESTRELAEHLSTELLRAFEANSSPDWLWLEDVVTYANGKIPHSLILAGSLFGDRAMYEKGLDILQWLLRIQTSPKGHLSVIGSNGWLKRGGKKAQFDQQPIDVVGLVQACAEAYHASGERDWLNETNRCFSWFLGSNDIGKTVCDLTTGGCFDGIHGERVNLNQGAESTLSYLRSLLTLYQIAQEKSKLMKPPYFRYE